MLTVLIVSVTFSVIVSALCSLMEAALYAVPLPHVKHLAESGSKAGDILLGFKDDIGPPISAILILNTISNTAGAAIAGRAVGYLWGDAALGLFTVGFVLTILYASEIFPKTIGVVYAKQTSRIIARPLSILVKVFTPLISISETVSEVIRGRNTEPKVSEEEVISLAAIGAEEGSIEKFEGSLVSNVLGLDKLLVKDILTPRVVVFRKEECTQLKEIADEIESWNYSRVPLYSEKDPDHLESYITQRDVYRELLKGNTEYELKQLSRPLDTVPELMQVDKLLLQMFEKRDHLCAVVDEHGSLAGIITLEDIIEELIGKEIVDEYDTVSDLRTFAKVLKFARGRSRKKKK